ncbi:hypothetical protein [Corallococcus llansteffanensis]|uniref:hypothetical protein n=1 Tax=Corallococcus llansteffanensis TaxID=2316731 RepID=UPI0011C40EEE|nr:hypothetical protein [Corallococcus llansteffanensis]
MSHFLHVVQAKDAAGGAALQLTLGETSTSYTVTLIHPTRAEPGSRHAYPMAQPINAKAKKAVAAELTGA